MSNHSTARRNSSRRAGPLGVRALALLGISLFVVTAMAPWGSTSAASRNGEPGTHTSRLTPKAATPATAPALDQNRTRALKQLLRQIRAAEADTTCRRPFLLAAEEQYQLNRFVAGQALTDLEADTVISRVLYEAYVLQGPDPANPDGFEARKSLLEQYIAYQASIGHKILDEDTGKAMPTAEASGGPDAFGYTFDDSNEPGGPAFNFIDITMTGTPITVTTGSADDGVGTATLGGPGFPFYGSNFGSLRVSTNGWITTDPANTTTDLSNDCPIPNSNVSTGAKLLVLHDDLRVDQGASNGMFHQYDAMNGVNIIQWNARHFGSTTDFRFQVQLFDDGTIIYQFPSGNPELGSGSTTGIQSAGATTGLQYACNAANSIPANLAVRFELGCLPLCPDDITVFGTLPQVVNFDVPTTPACTGTVTCVPASGSVFPVGTTPVTCTESDSGAMCSFSVTVTTCMQLVQDGSFEAGSPWPAWTTQTSTNFGTPICNTTVCNLNPGPRTGTNWNYFGGIGTNEAGSIGQMVTIPAGAPSAILRFYIAFDDVASPFNDTVTVSLGGTQITMYTEPSTSTPYTFQSFDLSAFADGVPRLLLFSHNGPSTGEITNIGIDDIELEVCLPECEITCPADVNVDATTPDGAVVNYPAPTTNGFCNGAPIICTPASGSMFPVGTTQVMCSVVTTPNMINAYRGAPPAGCSENFDGVSAPALPAGWSAMLTGAACGSGTSAPWITSTGSANSPPNAAFAPDPNCVNDNILTSVAFPIVSPAAQLSFRNSFNTEASTVTPTTGFDGGVLEISIGGGGFQDILAAGGSFSMGGYTRTISGSFSSPIAGRMAWSGDSGGYITTVVNLPASANGQMVVFRWRMATDSSISDVGWLIDDIVVTGCDTGGPPPDDPLSCTFNVTVTIPFNICCVNTHIDPMERDTFQAVFDPTLPGLHGYWEYTDVSSGEVFSGIANTRNGLFGRSITLGDNVTQGMELLAIVDWGRNKCLVRLDVISLIPERHYVLRDRNIAASVCTPPAPQ